MKIEDAQKLSDDEIRVKVAELRGWTYEGNGTWRDPDGVNYQALYPTRSGFGKIVGFGKYDDEEVPPNYPYDLNAMHEAEVSLGEGTGELGGSKMDKYCVLLFHTAGCHAHSVITATARQRAEAFVLVMENELTFAPK